MSEKLFGRVYESVGSSSSDLLIKSKGSVKIQWGNKYIDLIKNGEINYPKDKIQKLIISLIEQNTEEIFKSLEELKVLNESFEEIKKTLQDLNIINPSTSNGSNILTQLDNRITEEIDRAIQAEGFINTAIVNETDRATQQEKFITDNLNEEIERSTNKDSEFEESLQLVFSSSGLDEYGNYIIADGSNYIAEATSIHDATVKLDTALKTESTSLNDKIDQEIEDRKTAISELDSDIVSQGGINVSINIVEEDGKITNVIVSETDIASATTLAKVKEDVDLFFKDASFAEAAKDILIELQNYIDEDLEAAAIMTQNISTNTQNISNNTQAISDNTKAISDETERATKAEEEINELVSTLEERMNSLEVGAVDPQWMSNTWLINNIDTNSLKISDVEETSIELPDGNIYTYPSKLISVDIEKFSLFNQNSNITLQHGDVNLGSIDIQDILQNYLQNYLQEYLSNYFPEQSVVLYKGTEAPLGWNICDGNNDTPVLESPIEGFIYIIKQ